MSESVTFLVDNLYAEAIEAAKSRAALSASTPDLISILGDISSRLVTLSLVTVINPHSDNGKRGSFSCCVVTVFTDCLATVVSRAALLLDTD
jgi:hypothetical protein